MFCFSWEIRHVLILEDQSVWEFQLTRKLLDLVLVKHRRWGRRVKFPSERRFSCRNECIWHCENKMNEIFICFCFFQTRMFFFSLLLLSGFKQRGVCKMLFLSGRIETEGTLAEISHVQSPPPSVFSWSWSFNGFHKPPFTTRVVKARGHGYGKPQKKKSSYMLWMLSAPKEISVS